LSEQIGRTIRVTIGSDDLDEIEAAEADSRFFGIDSDGTTKALTVAEALALLSLEGSITPNPTTFWTNDAARALKIPDFESQVGVQMDTDEVWVSTGTSAGNWVQLQYFSGVMQAPNQTAAAADNLLTRSLGDARYLAAVKTTLVTASDSAWAFDSKTVFAEVSAVGGGGGGGGALSSLAANATAGNGGAAGAYGRKIWDVSALTIRTLNITIGAGGAGGTSGGNDGSNGGTTTVIDGDSSVTLTAPGGEAGAGDSNGTSLTQFRQSSGGEKIATGGDVNLPNQNGEGGFYQGTGIASALLAKGGTGGNSPYGRGGKGAQERGTSGANSDGVDGAGYGAGGGGGASIANGGSGLGGDGMGGVVEVKEYMLI
jgi:hypothetical protein